MAVKMAICSGLESWNSSTNTRLIRSPKRLTRARRILLELREEIQSFYRGCRLSRQLIELRNAVQTALLIVYAASLNPRSKGCHYVIDREE